MRFDRPAGIILDHAEVVRDEVAFDSRRSPMVRLPF
jgi:hypothetical protein